MSQPLPLTALAAAPVAQQTKPVAWIAGGDLELLKYGMHPIAGAKTADDDIALYLGPVAQQVAPAPDHLPDAGKMIEVAPAPQPGLYISGPYTVGKNAGRRSVCDVATGRVLGYLAEGVEVAPAPAQQARELTGEQEAFCAGHCCWSGHHKDCPRHDPPAAAPIAEWK